jgi:hypothetical protein
MSNNTNTNIEGIKVVILNCILVQENIRPAMMVQPIDYNERTSTDPTTSNILAIIKDNFPELLHSEIYENYQGIIISKTNHNGQKISSKKMGKILGYPCYNTFETIDHTKRTTLLEIRAFSKNGEEIQLIANVCKDEKTIDKFNELASNANEAFNKPKYMDLLKKFSIDLKEMKTTTTTIIPVEELINILIIRDSVSEEEEYSFRNVLSNLMFSNKLYDYKFEYDNQIHKGIMIGLLLRNNHETEVDEHLEMQLINILNKTKLLNKTNIKKKRKTRKSKIHNTI